MNNRLDQLFKDKLADHTETPRPDLWLKLKAGLSKKNRSSGKMIAFRMAASVLLLATFVWTLVWLQSRTLHNLPSAVAKVAENPPAVSKKVKEVQKVKDKASKTPMATAPKKPAVQMAPTSAPLDTTLTTQTPKANGPVIRIAEQIPTPPPLVIANNEKPSKSIVLEYTLEPIPARTETTVAASEPKERTGLRRVLDFAWDAKNSEGALSELRQAKDGLFALNFRKEKQKNPK
jgi:hypothetical protein